MFAANLLAQTRFDVEVAGVLARSASLTPFVQYSLFWDSCWRPQAWT